MTESLVKLLLIDDDLVFRLGLRTWLSQFPDFQVVGEAETGIAALQILAVSPAPGLDPINLILLNWDLGHAEGESQAAAAGLQLCQVLKSQYPQIPILLLSALPPTQAIAMAQQIGVEGYCAKTTKAAELLEALRRVATGQTYWPTQLVTAVDSVTPTESAWPSRDRLPTPPTPTTLHPLRALWQNQRLSGLAQIDAALAHVTNQLRQPGLPVLERAVLAGRWRELRVARWVVNRWLAPATPPTPRDRSVTPLHSPLEDHRYLPLPEPNLTQVTSTLATHQPVALEVVGRSQQSRLFDRTFSKLQSPLQNLTNTPLEIDILREEKKRELLYIILRKLEETLDELRFAQVQPPQLLEKQAAIVRDLWIATTTEFFGKYYTLQLGSLNLEVVRVLLQDTPTVQSEILNKISLSFELLAYLLFQAPLIVDNVAYAAHTPEALERAECLLQNLLVQVANAVMQPLLNHFADVEAIKQAFYDRRLISTREIERFRNSLSWKYRLERYVGEPKAIFESQYELLVLDSRGIAKTSIYAPRNQELRDLSGLQLVVTLVLETRDAIAPRFRAAIAWVGSGFVYVLTEVLGRGIGLIGRGILQGIGNAWQDPKAGKNSDRSKL
jgi:DNA-binding NarL/FixJ family response regulator